jgi:hypothetical protein
MNEKEEKNITISVNGQPYEFEKNYEITYEEVVKLVFPNYDTGKVYSIIYRRGPESKPEGILPPGGSVKLKDGEVFRVSETSQS